MRTKKKIGESTRKCNFTRTKSNFSSNCRELRTSAKSSFQYLPKLAYFFSYFTTDRQFKRICRIQLLSLDFFFIQMCQKKNSRFFLLLYFIIQECFDESFTALCHQLVKPLSDDFFHCNDNFIVFFLMNRPYHELSFSFVVLIGLMSGGITETPC